MSEATGAPNSLALPEGLAAIQRCIQLGSAQALPCTDDIYGRIEFVCTTPDGSLPPRSDLRMDTKPAAGVPRPCSAFVFGPETLRSVLENLPLSKSFLVSTLGLRPESVDRQFQQIAEKKQVGKSTLQQLLD